MQKLYCEVRTSFLLLGWVCLCSVVLRWLSCFSPGAFRMLLCCCYGDLYHWFFTSAAVFFGAWCELPVASIHLFCFKQGIDTYTPLLVSINMRGIQIYVFLYCKSISLLILSLSLDFIWSLSLICSTIYILKYVLLITYFHVRLLSLHNNEHAHFFLVDYVLIYLI
jgi:hypothetical protein